MNALDFLVEASRGDGRIVSSGDLNEYQMAEARQNGKWFVDEETGLGWALLPWDLVTDRDLEREKARARKVVVATDEGTLDPVCESPTPGLCRWQWCDGRERPAFLLNNNGAKRGKETSLCCPHATATNRRKNRHAYQNLRRARHGDRRHVVGRQKMRRRRDHAFA